MGKFFIRCRIQLKFCLRVRLKRWNGQLEFELDRAKSKNDIAENSVALGPETHNSLETVWFLPSSMLNTCCIIVIFIHDYLPRGGNKDVSVCLSVCLSVKVQNLNFRINKSWLYDLSEANHAIEEWKLQDHFDWGCLLTVMKGNTISTP